MCASETCSLMLCSKVHAQVSFSPFVGGKKQKYKRNYLAADLHHCGIRIDFSHQCI